MVETWSELFPDATENTVKYTVDGISTFEHYVNAIETATSRGDYIYILGWMLDITFPLTGTINPFYPLKLSGKKGKNYFNGPKTLFNLLKTATEKGVEVRILIWGNPMYHHDNLNSLVTLSELTNTKIFIDNANFTPGEIKSKIEKYAPIIWKMINIIYRYSDKLVATFNKASIALAVFSLRQHLKLLGNFLGNVNVGSHHEKILIVKGNEGLISFCGGIDINQNRFAGYHDTACQVKGPEANRILKKFIKRWINHDEAKLHPLTGTADSTPTILDPVVGKLTMAKTIGTYNSPDGKDRDRSLRDAYLNVISRARNYIYIEDQYLVNLDVANALNKKLKDKFFKKLIIVIQDSRKTTDIMIPDRKRGEFISAVRHSTSEKERSKFSLFMLDDIRAKNSSFHSGIHSKTLIVDDELAIVGSGNVNQRSFTLDSETSIVVFDSPNSLNKRNNFAYQFRQHLWADFIIINHVFSDITWEEFARLVKNDAFSGRYSYLIPYRNSVQDLDIRLGNILQSQNKILPTLAAIKFFEVEAKDLTLPAVSFINNSNFRDDFNRFMFDFLWAYVIDPKVKDRKGGKLERAESE